MPKISFDSRSDEYFKAFLVAGLLGKNFFPNQKEHSDELPPIVSSVQLTAPVAAALRNLQEPSARTVGYDHITYRSTRFNGVSRLLSIPHPKPYCELVHEITDNWSELSYILSNSHSKVQPREHSDGRVVVMDYGSGRADGREHNDAAFGKAIVARTDISNCFPSIYTHAIPWAIVGQDEAKKTKSDKKKWYNKLDAAARRTKRSESQGLPIGPATSTILAESILAKVDEALHQKGYVFERYIDDYSAYCDSHAEAEDFVLDLGSELAKYQLYINPSKTIFDSLPSPSASNWVLQLRRATPAENVTPQNLSALLDLALGEAQSSPEGSVLKYALRAATKHALAEPLDLQRLNVVLSYALSWAYSNAALVPLLDSLWEVGKREGSALCEDHKLQALLDNHLRYRRFDAVTWLLYFYCQYRIKVPESSVDAIIQSGDCMALLLLYAAGTPAQKKRVVRFCKALDRDDLYMLDQFWLLLYQVYFDKQMGNPYKGDKTFSVLRQNGVSFLQQAKSIP